MMNSKEKAAWIESLKVGDEVCVRTNYSQSIARVSKITPKQVRVGSTVFHKAGDLAGDRVGDRSGGGWSFALIEPVTDEAREEIERRTLVVRLTRNVVFNKLDLQQLRAIDAIVKGGAK